MSSIYGIRLKYQDGKNQILKYGKNMSKRDSELRKLKKDKEIKEAVPFEEWG